MEAGSIEQVAHGAIWPAAPARFIKIVRFGEGRDSTLPADYKA